VKEEEEGKGRERREEGEERREGGGRADKNRLKRRS
jgi:hypothetical protein